MRECLEKARGEGLSSKAQDKARRAALVPALQGLLDGQKVRVPPHFHTRRHTYSLTHTCDTHTHTCVRTHTHTHTLSHPLTYTTHIHTHNTQTGLRVIVQPV